MIVRTPQESLNKSYKKVQIDYNSYTQFLDALEILTKNIKDEGQREDTQKDMLTNFLTSTFYSHYMVCTGEDNIDLVIRLDRTFSSNIGVLWEIKGIGKADMPTTKNLDCKAVQELVLYYFRQRAAGNNEIRHLIVSNTREFFIFDAKEFERFFYNNATLKRQYHAFINGSLPQKTTDFFYKNIASPIIRQAQEELPFTYFSLDDYKSAIKNRETSGKLTMLYRLLSPIHLLKLPFQNDSNSLNTKFYTELLHIIGLEEYRNGAKTLIRRKEVTRRESASLLENTINFLKSEDSWYLRQHGKTEEECLFNVAMELCITWINRILFLKLLEAQLLNYHKGNQKYRFLSFSKIPDFDTLDSLFFQVMAKKPDSRLPEIKEQFPDVPYLNSSLFEVSDIERTFARIGNLSQSNVLSILPNSVLLNDNSHGHKKKLPLLEYLFAFLDSYNFSGDSNGEVAKKPKTLINASVLGLIFEKINGYKDGSVFTPGFITKQMCHNTLRQAVVNKFNEAYGWTLKSFEELRDADYDRIKANEIINSLTVCDPAVGSGHFLVSALNEIILIKYELKCLLYNDGHLINPNLYEISIENDELIITISDKELWSYNPSSTESRRIQEALFNEKRTIIENCLFGVDINPNSVNICRLRLWIELLKNAYYTCESGYTQLETLPNIDINIKCGNSLLHQFSLSDTLTFKDINKYKKAVKHYKQTKSKRDKTELSAIIDSIKQQFVNILTDNSPALKKLRQASMNYSSLIHNQLLDVNLETEQIQRLDLDKKNAKAEFDKAKKEVDKIKANSSLSGYFEWRIEFPEVLDDKGDFIGFDVVIGNPPYGVSIKDDYRQLVVARLGKVPDYEIYYFFIQQAKQIAKPNGLLSYIIPNTFLFNQFAAEYRRNIFNSWDIHEITDLTKLPVFQSAVVRNVIIRWSSATRTINAEGTFKDKIIGYRSSRDVHSFADIFSRPIEYISESDLLKLNQNWALAFALPTEIISLCNKISENGTPLSQLFDVSQGYIPYRKSDLVKLYGETEAKRMVESRVWHSPQKIDDTYIQEIYGRDISKYDYKSTGEFVKYGRHVACYVDLKFFTGDRILVREITNPSIIACIVSDQFVNDPQLISIITKTDITSIYILWAILNSKLATFYHFNHSPKATKGAFPKILVQDIKDFPIPELSPEVSAKIETTVKTILELKRNAQQADTSALEKKIDIYVYQLYKLTYEEILLIDPATTITQQEYQSLIV